MDLLMEFLSLPVDFLKMLCWMQKQICVKSKKHKAIVKQITQIVLPDLRPSAPAIIPSF